MKKIQIQLISILTSALFFFTQSLCAYSVQSNLWMERSKNNKKTTQTLAGLPLSFPPLDSFNFSPKKKVSISNYLNSGMSQTKRMSLKRSIPKNLLSELTSLIESFPQFYGIIRKIDLPDEFKAKNKIVIHIQDVHMNFEAQQNISQVVQHLIDEKSVQLVALEGAFGPLDLSVYRNFPDNRAIRVLADYFLNKHEISGPVYSALTSRTEIPDFIGVDDPVHYKANVNAYLQSLPQMRVVKRTLNQLKNLIELEKKEYFNAPLLMFDEKVQAYQNEDIKVGEYVRFLSKSVSQTSLILQVFIEALELEEKINFERVEAERARLLQALLSKLNGNQVSDLTKRSIAFRMGKLNHGDFYSYIKTLCLENAVDLTRYPQMNSYVQYILLSESLNPETLMNEISELEKRGYSSLVKSGKESVLLERSRYYTLAKKLVNFSLVKKEWNEYKEAVKNKKLNLASFENFYREAEARDEAIVSNMLKMIASKQRKVTVLVTGGFHSDGITRKLKKEGVTIVTVAPKISHVENGNKRSYLSVFAQERTPLDQMFKGEKLFLAKSPIFSKYRGRFGALNTAVRTGIPVETAADILGFKPRGRVKSNNSDQTVVVMGPAVVSGEYSGRELTELKIDGTFINRIKRIYQTHLYAFVETLMPLLGLLYASGFFGSVASGFEMVLPTSLLALFVGPLGFSRMFTNLHAFFQKREISNKERAVFKSFSGIQKTVFLVSISILSGLAFYFQFDVRWALLGAAFIVTATHRVNDIAYRVRQRKNSKNLQNFRNGAYQFSQWVETGATNIARTLGLGKVEASLLVGGEPQVLVALLQEDELLSIDPSLGTEDILNLLDPPETDPLTSEQLEELVYDNYSPGAFTNRDARVLPQEWEFNMNYKRVKPATGLPPIFEPPALPR